jgi:penicillin-binding protein-related factor A (putative recombinase)
MAVWQDAEKAFEQFYSAKGYNLYRFEDFGDVNFRSGRNTRLGGKVGVAERPSDYLLTEDGQMYYVEVKSCSNSTSFPFKNVAGSQWRAAMKQVAAGGRYDFTIYSVENNQWFRVPAQVLLETREQGRKSLAYKTIQQYRWVEMEEYFSTFTA